MILSPKTTHIAFRCPSCGDIVRGIAGAFGLGKQDMLRLRCPCEGRAEMSMVGTADRRIRLSVPCLICGKDHRYTLNESLFYGKDIFHLTCPYTDIDIGFFGKDEEALNAATEKSTEELNALYDELIAKGATPMEEDPDCDRATPDGEEPFLPDAQIYDIVRFMVKELEAEGEIDCPCGLGTYEVELTAEGIRIFCPDCGAAHLFATNSLAAAQEFLNCDHLKLEIPN